MKLPERIPAGLWAAGSDRIPQHTGFRLFRKRQRWPALPWQKYRIFFHQPELPSAHCRRTSHRWWGLQIIRQGGLWVGFSFGTQNKSQHNLQNLLTNWISAPSLHAADMVRVTYALISFQKHRDLCAARIIVLGAAAYAEERGKKACRKGMCRTHTEYAAWKETKCN